MHANCWETNLTFLINALRSSMPSNTAPIYYNSMGACSIDHSRSNFACSTMSLLPSVTDIKAILCFSTLYSVSIELRSEQLEVYLLEERFEHFRSWSWTLTSSRVGLGPVMPRLHALYFGLSKCQDLEVIVNWIKMSLKRFLHHFNVPC